MYSNLKIYNKSIECNNCIYSIDKIRLKTYITYEKYNNIDFYLRTYFNDKIEKFYISNNIKTFRYNWEIEIEEGKSFYFGFCHNTEEKKAERYEPQYNFTIEFNPNKLKDNNLVMYLLNQSGIWYLLRYDLAMDIPVNINDLIIDKSGKRKLTTYSYGKDDKTYVLGSTDRGRVKIYNKKIESDLHIVGDLTRIESTIILDTEMKINDIVLYNPMIKFPDIYLNSYVYSLSDIERKEKDATLYAVLYAIQNGYPINDLTKTYRKRIKEMLQGGYLIKFDNKSAVQVLRATIFYYFLNNKLCVFR